MNPADDTFTLPSSLASLSLIIFGKRNSENVLRTRLQTQTKIKCEGRFLLIDKLLKSPLAPLTPLHPPLT
jgi:hypothetical protein